MPLETATYTADLVTSNPAASDAVSTTDDHLRMIKGALKATFPNFSSAPLSSTQAQIDAAVAAVVTNGVTLLNSAHAYNPNTSGLNFPTLHRMDLVVNGATPMQISDDNTVQHNGAVTITTGNLTLNSGVLNGPGAVPIGGMIMWLTDTLPTLGQWCWANGGVLSRTGNGAALYALTGTTYGAGDGVTTFNVINMQEVVPVGKSAMGGATSPGLLSSISSGLKGALGGLFGADTTALTASLIPTITSRNASQNITVNTSQNVPYGGPNSFGGNQAGTSGYPGFSTVPTWGILGSSGSNDITVTSNNTGGTNPTHNNVQPSRAVNFIIRIG